MKIELPSPDSGDIETNCCWITIGNYTYNFDDSCDGEFFVSRHHKDADDDDIGEILQTDLDS
jgi:hypothetical protein